MNPELKPLADLIENLSESLSREIGNLRREMHDGFAGVNARFDAVNARQDLQGGKLRAGMVWSTRIDAWSDGVDKLIFERDKQILDLQQRVAQLERSRPEHLS